MSDKMTAQAMKSEAPSPAISAGFDRAQGARILARSFYRELRSSGYTPRQLLALSTELIDLITQDLQNDRKSAAGNA